MPLCQGAVKVLPVYDRPAMLVDSVVGMLQPKAGKVGEYVNEYLVGKLEYCEIAVRSKMLRLQASAKCIT